MDLWLKTSLKSAISLFFYDLWLKIHKKIPDSQAIEDFICIISVYRLPSKRIIIRFNHLICYGTSCSLHIDGCILCKFSDTF